MTIPDIRILSICLVIGVTVAWPAEVRAHSVEDGLRQCAAITDNDDRLRCFDALAAETTRAAAPPPRPPAQATPVSAAVSPPAATPEAAADGMEPISDEIGLSRIKGREAPEAQKYSATVTKCEESKQSGQYFFFFENGQVWKQTNYQKLRWRDCEFDVTVSKGTFGFEMYVPEKDRTIRVSRIR